MESATGRIVNLVTLPNQAYNTRMLSLRDLSWRLSGGLKRCELEHKY